MLKKIIFFISLVFFTNAAFSQNSVADNSQSQKLNILVFTKTLGYFHESIPNAIKAFYEIAHKNKWKITFTEDSLFFTEKELSKYNVVVFLLTSGDSLLNDEEKLAFQKYIEGGGGFLGVHSATDTEFKWPWFEKLAGAYFLGHPPVHEGKLIIENRNNPATVCFGADSVIWKEEYYSFDRDPRKNSNVKVLVSIDEKSYNINENPWFKNVNLVMGDHPLIWCQNIGRGRSFITSLGHQAESYDNEMIRKHLTGALLWAAGKTD
jgi:hypothetical protein